MACECVMCSHLILSISSTLFIRKVDEWKCWWNRLKRISLTISNWHFVLWCQMAFEWCCCDSVVLFLRNVHFVGFCLEEEFLALFSFVLDIYMWTAKMVVFSTTATYFHLINFKCFSFFFLFFSWQPPSNIPKSKNFSC